ncbi:MAG TPA: aldo/keto reductase [Stellaceae bacterium]|nr:aldo/keto reductase [Stellaceae bacterium]
MIFVKLGARQVPALGFGTWTLAGDACRLMVETALEVGYRHVDTAQVYENEADVGHAIARTRVPRGDIFLTTKIWRESLRAGQVASSFAQSLERLQTDYVDLLLIHWPHAEIPVRETLDAMQRLKSEGKIKAIGISNFTVRQMQEAVAHLGREIVCNQIEYHLLLSQRPVLDYARAHSIAAVAYCPLARGRLMQIPAVLHVAKKHGKSANQIALRWLLEQQGVAAIPKTGSLAHAKENFAIFDFKLDAEDHRALDALPGGTRLVSPAWAPVWDAA